MVSISGCRGVVGSSMTPTTLCRFVGAVASWLYDTQGATPGDSVVLGRDGRRGGELLHQTASAQLRACGFNVINLGVAMTPTVGVAVCERHAAGGLVITASHNPAQWNGAKAITRDGRAPTPMSAQTIVDSFHDGRSPHVSVEALGTMDADGAATHSHVARVLDALDAVTPIEQIKAKHFHVAVDSVNASGSAGARLLLEALGCELTHLNANDTGDFPHPPEPTCEHLSGAGGLCDAVRERRCDVGFAQDPDADRLAIIDEQGAYIGEEHTLVFATQALLAAQSDPASATLAANLSTSRMIDDVAAIFGARVRRTPVGETHVAQALHDHDGLVGGEGNGGVIWPCVVLIRDSLGAMALTLARMTSAGQTVSQLVGQTPCYSIVKRKTPIAEDQADLAVEAIAAHWSGANVDRQDGVRIDLPQDRAWLHVRASNTEPILRLIAEAPSEAIANGLVDEAERTLRLTL